jgi:hypothetical protein
MTDGTSEANADFRRNVGFCYDLVKANVERIVKGLTVELEDSPVTGPDGAFITGRDFLMDGGVTASYFLGDVLR